MQGIWGGGPDGHQVSRVAANAVDVECLGRGRSVFTVLRYRPDGRQGLGGELCGFMFLAQFIDIACVALCKKVLYQ